MFIIIIIIIIIVIVIIIIITIIIIIIIITVVIDDIIIIIMIMITIIISISIVIIIIIIIIIDIIIIPSPPRLPLGSAPSLRLRRLPRPSLRPARCMCGAVWRWCCRCVAVVLPLCGGGAAAVWCEGLCVSFCRHLTHGRGAKKRYRVGNKWRAG